MRLGACGNARGPFFQSSHGSQAMKRDRRRGGDPGGPESRGRALLPIAAGVAAIAAAAGLVIWREVARRPAPPASYVGGDACAPCHREQHDLWQGSHHALAMRTADSAAVLGDFQGAAFSAHGVTTTFRRRDGRFEVTTDGPDGTLRTYPVAYTFGFVPLQQYLIPFPGGRFQALSVAWDSRPAGAGGRHWFHLYPNEKIDHRDVLHWAGPLQNWNYMCADCHSTNLRKNYRAAEDTYDPGWTDISVSCEACHGPGSRHVAWAEGARRGRERRDPLLGFEFAIADSAGSRWVFDQIGRASCR